MMTLNLSSYIQNAVIFRLFYLTKYLVLRHSQRKTSLLTWRWLLWKWPSFITTSLGSVWNSLMSGQKLRVMWTPSSMLKGPWLCNCVVIRFSLRYFQAFSAPGRSVRWFTDALFASIRMRLVYMDRMRLSAILWDIKFWNDKTYRVTGDSFPSWERKRRFRMSGELLSRLQISLVTG